MQNRIIETEKQTLNMSKKAEEYNNLFKASQELQRSNQALSKAKYLKDNNDATPVAQVVYLEKELSKAQTNLAEIKENFQMVKTQIAEKYQKIPPEKLDEFYDNNPKYRPLSENPDNFSIEYLQELDRDLGAYIDKHLTSN